MNASVDKDGLCVAFREIRSGQEYNFAAIDLSICLAEPVKYIS